MSNSEFKLTRDSLPIASRLNPSNLAALLTTYGRVLLAAPQQKRHRTSPEQLQRLDTQRYTTLPKQLHARAQKDGQGEELGAFLSRAELQDLVEWKLARGVYRPTLPSLIASNPEQAVIETTKNAFKHYAEGTANATPEKTQKTVKMLCELRGVGPATASLLLSVAQAENVPFFSDELFYWTAATEESVHLEKIKYNAKEYGQIVEAVTKIQDRFVKDGHDRPRADDIERAAFVIQKLHNPDVWAAVFEGGSHGAMQQPVTKDSKGKKSKKADKAAVLEEAIPPTEEKSELTEKEKQEEIESKKQTLIEHGAKVKPSTKRSRPPEQHGEARRSTRLKR